MIGIGKDERVESKRMQFSNVWRCELNELYNTKQGQSIVVTGMCPCIVCLEIADVIIAYIQCDHWLLISSIEISYQTVS